MHDFEILRLTPDFEMLCLAEDFEMCDLWSAVGMTHVLRSGLVMGNATSYFPLIVLGYHSYSSLLPLRSLINGPPIGVLFGESLVIRLHSEIDQIHLSIEAQCVTTLLPLGDCHNKSDAIFQNKASGATFQNLPPDAIFSDHASDVYHEWHSVHCFRRCY